MHCIVALIVSDPWVGVIPQQIFQAPSYGTRETGNYMPFNKLCTPIPRMQYSNSLSICIRSSGVVEGGAAPLVKLIDIGSWTHQSKQALVVAVCSCVVQRCPKEEIVCSSLTIRNIILHKEWLWKRKVNTPSKAVLPVEICPRVEEKIQTLKVPVVENTF